MLAGFISGSQGVREFSEGEKSAHRPAGDRKGSQRDKGDFPKLMLVVPGLGRLRQEDCALETKPGHTARSCLKKLTNSGWEDSSVGKVLALEADLSSSPRTQVKS